MSDQEKLVKAVNELENEVSDDSAAEVIAEKAKEIETEEKLEEDTADRLKKTFVTGEKLETPAEPSDETDDSIPDEEKEEKPADDTDDDDGPTQAEKEEEAKLEAEEKKDKEEKSDSEAKDEDAEKSKKKKDDVPPLSDAYYRAAIHRGWKPEDVDELYKTNPELCVKTLGNIYEALNRSSREYATFGRIQKEQRERDSQPTIKSVVETAEKKSEFVGVDIEKLRKEYPDDPIVELVDTQQKQSKALFDRIQALETIRPAQTSDLPSGFTNAQIEAEKQQSAAIEQQIGTFFSSDELKGYDDFYGKLPKDAVDWIALTPGQKQNRWGVIEMMDHMITGAHAHGRDMKIDEALRLAHLSVTEPIREKVIRDNLKAEVIKRSKGITLKPSATARPESMKPQTKEDLLDVTTQRLQKVFG